MPPDPLQLEYAPGEPPRKSPFRRFIIVTFIALLGVVAVRHGSDVASAVHRRWVQSRCATFEYPENTVIYDTDPAAGQALLREAPDDYVRITDTTVWPRPAVIRKEPGCWASLKDILFNTRQFWPPGPPAPKLMVHRLRHPVTGEERIVAIIVAPDSPSRAAAPAPPGGRPALTLVAAAVDPAQSWSAHPRWDGNSGNLYAGFESAARLRLYAARLDPEFPNRFSIRYDLDGQPGTIDGRLEPDGRVSMTVRDGPAKPRESHPLGY